MPVVSRQENEYFILSIVEIENYLPVSLRAVTFPQHTHHPRCTVHINGLFRLQMPEKARHHNERTQFSPFPSLTIFFFQASQQPSCEENQETKGYLRKSILLLPLVKSLGHCHC